MPDPVQREDTAAALSVCVTQHHSLTNSALWTAQQTTWGSFVQGTLAAGHRRDLNKKSAPLISLYSLREGGKRCDPDVTVVYGLCLDFDGVAIEAVADSATRLQRDGVAVLWHTTWKHGRKLDLTIEEDAKESKKLGGALVGQRRRLIIPLAEPLDPRSFRDVYARTLAHYAETADRTGNTLNRGFFVPSCHPDRANLTELHYLPGGGYRPSKAVVPLAPVAPRPVRQLEHEAYAMLRQRWRKSPRTEDLALRLGHVLDGVPFADHGERDTILWELLRAITHAYPDVAAESVVALFERSLAIMAQASPLDHLTEHDVREKLERARVIVADKLEAALPPERKSAIRQAFGSSRATPYTEAELAEIREALSVDDLTHVWILHDETEQYLVGRGGRLHVAGIHGFVNTARVVLAPAPVDLYTVDLKDGRRLLTGKELLEKYSTPLAEVRRSLVLTKPKLDLPTRTLTIPVCPLRPIEPRFDVNIDRWLQLLAGDHYVTMVQWLAKVPELSRPLTGLVLTGAPGAGKSVLANGLSRLWSEDGPSALNDALGAFNATLERCPYTFCDEGEIPRDARGDERTGALREFVQATSRTVNEKYRRAVRLDGAARLQISANNDSFLRMSQALTEHDIDALAQRFTRIHADTAAAVYLAERGGRAGCEPWVEGDGIAAHCLYLAGLGTEWVGRFGVAPDPSMANDMAVRTGARASICELIVRVLKDDARLIGDAHVVDGRVVVHVDWIIGMWESVMRKAPCPRTGVLADALAGLGTRLELDGLVFVALDTERLIAWAVDAGYCTPGRIRDWIAKHG